MSLTRRASAVLLAAFLCLVLVAPAAGAKKGGSKPVRCKGGQIQVKVGKKKACMPLAKAFPPPRAVDLRLAYLRQALKLDPAKAVKGKKRKRARTLQSGFGKAGKRAQKKLLRLLPKALAFVDRRRGARASVARAGLDARPLLGATASAGCGVGPAGPRGTTDGATIGMLGDNGGFIEAPAGNGLTVRVTFVSCGGVSSFTVSECPKADGTVEAAPASGDFRATVEVRDGERVVSRNSSQFEDKSKARGKVAADAKLDHVDLEHKQEVLIVASGGIVIRGGVLRKIRIDMRSGKYDPNEASVVFNGDRVSADMGAAGFARSADGAIGSFRAAESRWSDLGRKPHCAQAELSPASGSQKVKKGATGQFSVHAKARDGGRATGAKWELLGAENATFNPTSSQDPGPAISYTVSNSVPPGGKVKVSVRFTSTAGVGESSWVQDVELGSISKLVGSFSGEFVTPTINGPKVESWSGTATLERNSPDVIGGPNGTYDVKSAGVTYHVSGREGLVTGCQWSGTAQAEIPAGPTHGGAGVFGTPPDLTEPYEYSIGINTPAGEQITFTRHDCPEGAEDWEGTTETIPWGVSFNTEQQTSPDGITYSGSREKSFGGATLKDSWDFEARP